MTDSILYIWFQMATGICSPVSREIFGRFSSMEEIYKNRDFSFLGEKRKRIIKNLCDKDTSEAFEVLKRCKKLGAFVVGYYDDSYPSRLRNIDTPPACLYCIGRMEDLNGSPCVAVVGTRRNSDYGGRVAEEFAYGFSKSGVVVVSGLAKGVDLCAHRGAVRAGGYTVGVLGTPIGVIYPKENKKAFETLYRQGLVVSEMYPGCPSSRAAFPNRNRIISGMCDATVVAEAGDGSGSLITARHAVHQGRKLYAVPGDIGVDNHGTNCLIKQGATVATEPYDVVADLKLEFPDGIFSYSPQLTSRLRSYGMAMELNGEDIEEELDLFELDCKKEKTIVSDTQEQIAQPKETGGKNRDILSLIPAGKAVSTDELVRGSGMSMAEVLSQLIMLEIEGRIISAPGGRYCKTQ